MLVFWSKPSSGFSPEPKSLYSLEWFPLVTSIFFHILLSPAQPCQPRQPLSYFPNIHNPTPLPGTLCPNSHMTSLFTLGSLLKCYFASVASLVTYSKLPTIPTCCPWPPPSPPHLYPHLSSFSFPPKYLSFCDILCILLLCLIPL